MFLKKIIEILVTAARLVELDANAWGAGIGLGTVADQPGAFYGVHYTEL